MWIDDQVMAVCDQDLAIKVFIPESPVVVLGSSNKPEIEANLSNCQHDKIQVLKRRGGGGTVLLYSGCLVVSIGTWVKDYYENSKYFAMLNQSILDVLGGTSPELLHASQSGISDLVLGDRKFGGTSLYRSRHYLLYQASLIVNLDAQLIARYLQHPSREPDYRRGRSHSDFLVGLASVADGLTPMSLRDHMQDGLPKALVGQLGEKLISPVGKQLAHIRSNAGL